MLDTTLYTEKFIRDYYIAVATGCSHHKALTYAQAQDRINTSIDHLREIK